MWWLFNLGPKWNLFRIIFMIIGLIAIIILYFNGML